MTEDIKKVTRTGLILAVTLILQGLRMVIPIPPQVSMFVVGSLVNACLIVAVLLIGRRAGLVVAGCTPCLAGRDAALLSLCLSRRAGQLFLRLDGLALAAVRSAGFLRRCLGEGGHPLWLVLPAVRLYCVSAGCAPYAVVCYELAPDCDRHHRGGPGNGSQPSPRASA